MTHKQVTMTFSFVQNACTCICIYATRLNLASLHKGPGIKVSEFFNNRNPL